MLLIVMNYATFQINIDVFGRNGRISRVDTSETLVSVSPGSGNIGETLPTCLFGSVWSVILNLCRRLCFVEHKSAITFPLISPYKFKGFRLETIHTIRSLITTAVLLMLAREADLYCM